MLGHGHFPASHVWYRRVKPIESRCVFSPSFGSIQIPSIVNSGYNPYGFENRVPRTISWWIICPMVILCVNIPSSGPHKKLPLSLYIYINKYVYIYTYIYNIVPWKVFAKNWQCTSGHRSLEISGLTSCQVQFLPDLVLADFRCQIFGEFNHWLMMVNNA